MGLMGIGKSTSDEILPHPLLRKETIIKRRLEIVTG